ncbi:stage V sporulation protein B [Calidifontibacillus erzurumensis]|uniref:Stage V sporulation protein B n=1 Tax=Calidifontibacillus erzurumensis TaxID=2741433 RepID=A0A8J8GBJ9_9BACI|nr:stage V sporulation protein B [Calidifontibacillus erzurumensis]NSL50171.1 stage V sporulation protein B [Calidifontibacillus erzurumensis]
MSNKFKQSFLRGTLILIMAGLITRFLGFVNRIVVARIMGEEGVGLYMMALPTFLLTITLTQLGLPVAISKLVAEADAVGDQRKIKKILVVSLAITSVTSIIFTVGLIIVAPILAHSLLTDDRTYYPLMAIAPIVPIIALSSVLRGYFQGLQNMRPAAYSQVIEQIVRIALVAVFTKALLPYGVEYAAAGAMISAVCGEFASLLYMIAMFKRKKRIKVRRNFFQQIKEGKNTLNDLLRIALPTTGSRLIGSISYFFEPIVVSQSLALAGIATTVATKQYGELTGYAIPLLLLPSFVTTSLSVSLVPAISEAAARGQFLSIEHRLQQALRLTLVTGGLSMVVLYVFANPIMELMFRTTKPAVFVQMMAPFFLLLYFQGPLQATLQALDLAKAAMLNSLVGAFVKIVAIFAFASRPEFGIIGVAIAIILGILLVTLLHFATIIKTISFTFYVKDFIKSIVTMIASGIIGGYVFEHYLLEASLPVRTVIGILITSIAYFVFLAAFRLVVKEEVKRIPVFGSKLALFFPNRKKR